MTSQYRSFRFRWVFCQLEMLRNCLAPSLRRQLNELPKSLDETYERVLKEIESTNQGRHARRLLHCLAVAIRPLSVAELAEVLAVDLDAADGEIPRFHAEWRWEDQEQAVLSACSSLVSIVDRDGCRVVQFSHFSVKEYLTSTRLSAASGDISRYQILPEPAHLILARASLVTLLDLDNRASQQREERFDDRDKKRDQDILLVQYAAEHWVSHAQVGNVSSYLKDAIETLFDPNKPYLLAWVGIHNIDPTTGWTTWPKPKLNPVYYAALCGFYDLVRHLVVKHPEEVNHHGGYYHSPLVASLSRKHFRVADFLVKNGAYVNVQGHPPLFLAIQLSDDECVDAVQFLLRNGTDVNATEVELWTPLHLAAETGYPKVAQILLEHRAEVNLRNEEGQTALHLVSTRTMAEEFGRELEGERSMLARLLVERGADVTAKDGNNATPLHLASYYGRAEISQLLLDHGANAQAEDIQGRSPLHEVSLGTRHSKQYPHGKCITSGRVFHPIKALSVARLLIERGVDANALDKDNSTPLHLASSHGMLDIARFLLNHGAKANAKNASGQTALHLVSQGEYFSCDNPDVTRLLLELGLDVNAQDKDKATPLHFACSYGNFETALLLLDQGAKVYALNADGQTPLHRVSQGRDGGMDDDPRISRLMLERGADVNARDKNQATPLHLASYKSKSQTVQVLLDYGAEADARNAEGQTPLHRVSQTSVVLSYNPDSRVAQLLLERGVDVNARDKVQATPLHFACFSFGMTQTLLDYGADANAQNADGQTPLHLLSQNLHPYSSTNYSHIVQLLLERGADVNARDQDQATPLHLASYSSKSPTVEVLLDHGAEPDARNVDGQTPLHRALQCTLWISHSEITRQLLGRGVDVNARDKDQATPLHIASYYGLADAVDVLLDYGALANAEDVRAQTPLHQVLLSNFDYNICTMRSWSRASHPSRVRLARRLLDRGADVNTQNKEQETPLHLATRIRSHEMAQVLLEHGADPNMKNSKGKSPLQLACGRKGRAIKQLLSEYASKEE